MFSSLCTVYKENFTRVEIIDDSACMLIIQDVAMFSFKSLFVEVLPVNFLYICRRIALEIISAQSVDMCKNNQAEILCKVEWLKITKVFPWQGYHVIFSTCR